jgi:hypothetical protein
MPTDAESVARGVTEGFGAIDLAESDAFWSA